MSVGTGISIPASAITQTVSEWVNKLSIEWDRIGVTQSERQSSIDMLVQDFKQVLSDRYNAQCTRRQSMEQQITDTRTRILAISKQIHCDTLLQDNIAQSSNLTTQLSELQKQLQNAVTQRDTQVQQFIEPLTQLRQCMIQLHKQWFDSNNMLISNQDTLYGQYECVLCSQPEEIDLTNTALQTIQQCVTDSKHEIEARTDLRYTQLHEINMLLKLLEFDSVDAVGVDAVALNESQWEHSAVHDITDDTVHAFTVRLDELRQTKCEQDSIIELLVVQIDSLWKRLNISVQDRDQFKNRHTTVGQRTIDALQVEIRRLEELKQANIQQFIESTKLELIQVWDGTRTLQSTRDAFLQQYHNQYNDHVLNAYEAELSRVQSKLKSMQSVLELVNKRIQYKNDAVILAERLKDPDRFKGKGVSQKMAEENRLRNNIEKLAPKNDIELRGAVIEWEREWNDTFYVNNEPLLHSLEIDEQKRQAAAQNKRGSKNANSTDPSNQFAVPNTPASATSNSNSRPGTATKLVGSNSKRNLLANKENNHTMPSRQHSNLSNAVTPTKIKRSSTLTSPIPSDKLTSSAAPAQPIVKRTILGTTNR